VIPVMIETSWHIPSHTHDTELWKYSGQQGTKLSKLSASNGEE
jgi:hypothetical protein